MNEDSYVVTFDRRPGLGPGALDGLKRMSLAEAWDVIRLAGRIPKHGLIVNVRTLKPVGVGNEQ